MTWMDWRCDIHATLHQNLLLEKLMVALTLQLSTPRTAKTIAWQYSVGTWFVLSSCIMVNRCIMLAAFSKQFLRKKLVIAHCRDDLDTNNGLQNCCDKCDDLRSQHKNSLRELLPIARCSPVIIFLSQEFIERTVADALCSPVIFIQHSFPFIAWFEGETNQIISLWGCHI